MTPLIQTATWIMYPINPASYPSRMQFQTVLVSVGKTPAWSSARFEQLNEGLNLKLTLISAPAGFGKTTLVTEWLDNTRGDVKKENQTEDCLLIEKGQPTMHSTEEVA